MKKIVSLFILALFINTFSYSQYLRASLWTSDMNAFASSDALNGIPQGVVLFAGSSTFRMWSTLATDFPDSPVLNRAFGGSYMTDLIYFFDQVVKPYTPIQVVLYEGDNDLYGTSTTAAEFLDDVITMTRMINIYYPNAKILLVSIKPSPSRTSAFTVYQEANALMKSYAEGIDYITYVDTWTPMLNNDGTPNSSLFGSDMLHMNSDGYALWTSILKPYLLTGDGTVVSSDKVIYTESTNPTYHDYSWINVTSPSVFNTLKSEKIGSDSIYHHNGSTSLKISYQGVTGGNWKACIAAESWAGYDITGDYDLTFWVYSPTAIAGTDLPAMYLEPVSGTTTGKINMSDYISSIPANSWTKVTIPVSAWKDISPDFAYNNVKTIFFTQLNTNSATVTFYVDDVVYTAASAETGEADIYIDFGSTTMLSGTGWNNITDTQTASDSLKLTDGTSSGILLKVTDPFYNGYNTGGTTTTSDDAAEFIETASEDNFFGHVNDFSPATPNPLGQIELSGLDPVKYYSFTFFASRMNVSDVRDATYSIIGSNGTLSAILNSSNNESNVVSITDVQPTSEGKLTLNVEVGPNNTSANKFFYLGAMTISISNVANSVNETSVDKIQVYYNNDILHIGNITGKVTLYNLNGSKISEGHSIFGQYKTNLEKGVYIVKFNNEARKFLVN